MLYMHVCLQVLRSWGHKQLANNINEAGRRLLALEGEDPKDKKHKEKEATDLTEKGALSGGETSADEKTDASDSLPLHALKRKRAKRAGVGAGKEEPEGPANEELKALEAHMLSLSKQGQYMSSSLLIFTNRQCKLPLDWINSTISDCHEMIG